MNTVPAPAIAARGRVASSRAPTPPGWLVWLVEHRAQILAVFAFAAIVVGGLLHLVGEGAAGQTVWGVAVAVLAAELTVEVGRTVVVEHSLGVDTIALVAMVGALALGEELAGVVIGLMFSGGAALEAIASRRARRELTALVQRAPKTAQLRIDDRLEEVAVERVEAGDVVLVRTGEVVPVDGTLISAEAVIDTSTLSGESLPETVRRGMPRPQRLRQRRQPIRRPRRPARARQRLRRAGAAGRAGADAAGADGADGRPVRRLLPSRDIADRGARLGVERRPGAGAGGRGGRNPVPADSRRADRAGVRPLARRALGSDRQGRRRDRDARRGADGPVRQDRHADRRHARGTRNRDPRRLGAGELLRLAASVDRLSAHVLGEALVAAAKEAELELTMPADVHEEPGQGIEGRVDGHRVAVGSRAFARHSGVPQEEIVAAASTTTRGSGEAHIVVAIDGHVAGVIVMADELRPDAERIVERLRAEGIRHVAMISGRPALGRRARRPRARRRPRLRRAVARAEARGRAPHRRRTRAAAR